MNSTGKRSWKLQDLKAHSANVNCLALGKKSGQVLATGGDDKKVNLWALGASDCIMSLSGHSTPVESVQFGIGEETLAAGCQSGSIKIWNLGAATVQRTLNGHKSDITSVDFHPYGDYLCSGSLDSFIKLWDLRRKGCIYTYKGHSSKINSIRFSPDGQWIASGGEDGVVRIWDLRAGKRISDLAQHSRPITHVMFHPHEFLLASASTDCTLNFWDLENFSLVSCTDRNQSYVRCMAFSDGGECLLAGDTEGLKVFGWEPARQYDSVPMSWGKVQDLVVTGDQLIGASFHQMSASIHIADLSLVHPLGTPPPQYTSTVPFSHNTSLRKSFTKKAPGKTKLEVRDRIENPLDEEPGIEEELLPLAHTGDYTSVFQPHRDLNRSPLRSTSSLASDNDTEDWPLVSPKPSSLPFSYDSPHPPKPSSPLPPKPSSFPFPCESPPLSPVRPQRKLSAHRPPSLSLAMMNTEAMSSPEYELPHKLGSTADLTANISKLYINAPPTSVSRGSSRTASPRRTLPPASPSYSSGSMDAPTSGYPYPDPAVSRHPYVDAPHRRPLERDVDEHNIVTSSPTFDKTSVEFAIPTKENEESRVYPNYRSKPGGHAYVPTNESNYSSPYGDPIMDASESRQDNRYSSRDLGVPNGIHTSHYNSNTQGSNQHCNVNNVPSNGGNNTTNLYSNTSHLHSNGSNLHSNTNVHSNVNSNHGNSPSSSRYRDYFRQASFSASSDQAPASLFSTKHSQDSGFSTLDSLSAGSSVGPSGRERERDQIIPMNLSSPMGLDMEQFLPKSYSTGGSKFSVASESELLSNISSGHEKMMAVLRNRERSLNLVFMAVKNKNIEAGVETALSMNDGTIMVDLLKSMIPRRNVWSLELCSTILPVIQNLLQSKYEMYITTACDTLNLILRTFGPVIKNNMKWSGGNSIGVDISKEERYKKCVKVYNALMPVKSVLLKKQTLQGKLGETFRDLLSELDTIDS